MAKRKSIKNFNWFQIVVVDDEQDWASIRSTTQSEILKSEKQVKIITEQNNYTTELTYFSQTAFLHRLLYF